MRRERTNLFPCRKTQFCDTLKGRAAAPFQSVAKVYMAFRAKPGFYKNPKSPGTCATDFFNQCALCQRIVKRSFATRTKNG